MSFPYTGVFREHGNFKATTYYKPTLGEMYSNLDTLLPPVYKFGVLSNLLYRFFRIFSDQAEFHAELTFCKEIFHKNGYLENFIDK